MSHRTQLLCAVAVVLAIASPARADYQLVRWSGGDCQIWNSDGDAFPRGDGWILLAWNLPTYEFARESLRAEIARGNCRW